MGLLVLIAGVFTLHALQNTPTWVIYFFYVIKVISIFLSQFKKKHVPSNKTVEMWHFAPYGVSNYVKHMKSIPSCKSSFAYTHKPKLVQGT